jgi:glycosidase
MPWTLQGGWQDPWLPLGDTTRNVDDQRADPSSTLNFTRDLIALRKRLDDLRGGSYEELSAPDGAWAWRRGDNAVVAINLGEDRVEIDGVDGTVELSTSRERDGETLDGALRLDASEGVVVQPRRPRDSL